MNRLITLAMMALMIQLVSAQYNSILNLRINNTNAQYKVYMNGQQMIANGNTVSFGELPAGQHLLEVYRINPGYRLTTYTKMFSDYVNIAPSTEYFATIYSPMNVLRFERAIALTQPYYEPVRTKPGRGPRWNNQQPGHCGTPPVVVPAGPFAMSDGDFGQLRQTISNAGFENTRLNIFKQALAYNYFTTAQVRDLMNEFWFESTKLEVAKLAYSKTIDQNNYYLVNNEFSFSSSVNELGDYVAMR